MHAPPVAPPHIPSAPPVAPASPTIEARYTAATLEKCARIQARQTVQTTFIIITITLVATLLSGKIDFEKLTDYMSLILMVGFPFVAAIFAVWCGNQDTTIALLDSFCYELEEYGSRHSGHPSAPRWYDSNDRWFDRSVVGRYWSNVAFGVALFGASLPGTIIIYVIGRRDLALICQMVVVCTMIVHRLFRYRVANQLSVRRRFHAVTAGLALVVAGMVTVYLHAVPYSHRKQDPPKTQIDYAVHLIVLSSLVSILPMAIHIEFERRRMEFLNGRRPRQEG